VAQQLLVCIHNVEVLASCGKTWEMRMFLATPWQFLHILIEQMSVLCHHRFFAKIFLEYCCYFIAWCIHCKVFWTWSRDFYLWAVHKRCPHKIEKNCSSFTNPISPKSLKFIIFPKIFGFLQIVWMSISAKPFLSAKCPQRTNPPTVEFFYGQPLIY